MTGAHQSGVRPSHLVLDTADIDRAVTFWTALLGMKPTNSEAEWVDLEPLGDGGPVLAFQQVPESKAVKNRLHLDLETSDVVALGEAAEALGATPAGPLHAAGDSPWRVWRDPEGNEFCLVTVSD